MQPSHSMQEGHMQSSWTVLACECYLKTLTIILAAIICAGVVVGVHAVALAKLGEGHFGLGEQALNLHEHYS